MSKRDPKPDDFTYRPYIRPTLTPAYRADIRRAAKAYADANRSDPFAYGRITLHMKQGLELPSEVLAEAARRKKVDI